MKIGKRRRRQPLDDEIGVARQVAADSAILFCTCCSATTMSVAGSNCAEISVAPRKLVERTRRMPGTSITACSIGRVTVSIIACDGSVPLWPMMTMRGNSSGG